MPPRKSPRSSVARTPLMQPHRRDDIDLDAVPRASAGSPAQHGAGGKLRLAWLAAKRTVAGSPARKRACIFTAVALAALLLVAVLVPTLASNSNSNSNSTTTPPVVVTTKEEAGAVPRVSAQSASSIPAAQDMVALTHPLSRDKGARLWDVYLAPLLEPRVPGTPGNARARDHIVRALRDLGGWTVELDAFNAETPYGTKPFANVVATRHAGAKKQLVLAAHYDSKLMERTREGREFIGATDSAAPCAMLLELAALLKPALDKIAPTAEPEVGLQLVFFDGEEAFKDWTATDSIYGSRHLAAKWAAEKRSDGRTHLQAMEMLVLLDLLGAPGTTVYALQDDTKKQFARMAAIETMLRSESLLFSATASRQRPYLFPDVNAMSGALVEDDHVPFVKRGVRALHLIPAQFPRVWHTYADDKSALDREVCADWARIVAAYTVEALKLKAP